MSSYYMLVIGPDAERTLGVLAGGTPIGDGETFSIGDYEETKLPTNEEDDGVDEDLGVILTTQDYMGPLNNPYFSAAHAHITKVWVLRNIMEEMIAAGTPVSVWNIHN